MWLTASFFIKNFNLYPECNFLRKNNTEIINAMTAAKPHEANIPKAPKDRNNIGDITFKLLNIPESFINTNFDALFDMKIEFINREIIQIIVNKIS